MRAPLYSIFAGQLGSHPLQSNVNSAADSTWRGSGMQCFSLMRRMYSSSSGVCKTCGTSSWLYSYRCWNTTHVFFPHGELDSSVRSGLPFANTCYSRVQGAGPAHQAEGVEEHFSYISARVCADR